METQDEVILPSPISKLPVVSMGISGMVYALSDSLVVKVAHDSGDDWDTSRQDHAIEVEIYRRVGLHTSIPQLHSLQNGKPILKHCQCCLQERLIKLREAGQRLSLKQSIPWALSIASGLQRLHNCHVLLDASDNAKICDFAGSSIDESCPTVAPSQGSEHPSLPSQEPTLPSELFAFRFWFSPVRDRDDSGAVSR